MDLRQAGLIATIAVGDLIQARAFYEEILGFAHIATFRGRRPSPGGRRPHPALPQRGAGTRTTLAGFEVGSLEPVMASLKPRGIRFEDDDVPDLKTVDQVAWIGPERAAWFRDSEGNVLSLGEPWRARGDAAG